MCGISGKNIYFVDSNINKKVNKFPLLKNI